MPGHQASISNRRLVRRSPICHAWPLATSEFAGSTVEQARPCPRHDAPAFPEEIYQEPFDTGRPDRGAGSRPAGVRQRPTSASARRWPRLQQLVAIAGRSSSNWRLEYDFEPSLSYC